MILGLIAMALVAAGPSFAKQRNQELAEALQTNALRNTLFYKALTDASGKSAPAVLRTIEDGMSSGKIADKNIAVQWLTDNSFGTQPTQETFSSFYFMFLSDLKAKDAITAQQLGKMKESEDSVKTAIRALMAFEILANADAERCGDPTVVDAVFELVAPRYRDLKFAFRTILDKEQYDRYAFEAIDIESRKSARPVSLDLCRMGQMGESDASYTPPAEDSSKAWSEKRNALRTQYKTIWSKRYYELRDNKK
jgi:hypothetical protein